MRTKSKDLVATMRLAALVCAGAIVPAVRGETLIDFTAADAEPIVVPGPARFRDGTPLRQVERRADGLVVRADSRYESGPAKWLILGLPKAVCSSRDWSDACFRIVLKGPPEGRMMSNLAVDFRDRDGEVFQLMRRAEDYNENGEFRLLFDLRDLVDGKKGWGTPKANGKKEPPLAICDIAIHYQTGADGLGGQGEGEAVLLRIESAQRPVAAAQIPRTVVSREPISTDAAYPGAAPFPGARELAFRFEPAFSGTADLVLSHGSSGEAKKGVLDTFQATVTNGIARFSVNLPYETPYQFFRIDPKPDASEARGPFKVAMAAGEFVQTAAEAMRLEVETGNHLHIVRDGKDERPVILIRNPARRDVSWTADIVLTDYFGTEVKIGFSRKVRSGETVRMDVPWPLPARGLWRVKASVKGDDGSEAVKEDRFAWLDIHEVTPKVEKPKFRMGIHYHGTKYWPDRIDLTIAALVAAGAKFVRCDYDHMWRDIEPRPGGYHWEKADAMVDKLTQAGLALDIIFAGTPSWAVDPESWNRFLNNQKAGLRVSSCCLMPKPGLFRDFCEKYGRRYGTRIDYYECGNEWDLTGTGSVDFNDFLQVQREAYEGLHAGCPDVCVTPNGWTTAISCTNADFRVWQHGLIEFFADHPECYDAWALHCHGEPSTFRVNISERFLPMRRAHKLRDRPWLLNETALSSANGMEDDVASAVWQKIVYGWAMGARDYIWYNLRATGWFDGGEPGYGLITCDFRPRSGYAAFSALSAVAQGLDFDATLHSRKLRHLFRFRGSSQRLKGGLALIGWDTRRRDAECRVRITTDATRATVVDLMGNCRPVKVLDGTVNFGLGYHPQALLLEGATRAEVADPAVLEREDAESVVIRGKSGPPQFVLDTARNVKDLYEANPAMAHRLWKGPADHSARIWLEPDKKGLRLRALVRDDMRADGDGMEITTVDARGRKRSLALKPVSRRETTDAYEAAVPVDGSSFGMNVVIRDDDGEGVDSFLFLRRESEDLLHVEVK